MDKKELLKELKDAGFESAYGCGHCGYDAFDWPPTLSELIDACGSDFDLRKMQHRELGWVYRAITTETSYEGKTPEEAVIKLYLKLNEKNEHLPTIQT